MLILTGFVIADILYLMGMAYFYCRSRATWFPDKGYHLWKTLLVFSFLPLALAVAAIYPMETHQAALWMCLNLEAIALSMLGLCVFYLRPRSHADPVQIKMRSWWKLLTAMSILILMAGPLILFIGLQ